MNRRTWIRSALVAAPILSALHGFGWEPRWLRRRNLRLAPNASTTFAFFTDLHFKGDPTLTDRVIAGIHAVRPAFAVFGGDLVEEATHLEELLQRLRKLQVPLYGIPGNHDYWSRIDFNLVDAAFRQTGGRWLMDETVVTPDGRVELAGHSCTGETVLQPGTDPRRRRIALVHYPAWADRLKSGWDLILAGHSHGGQVRLPFVGSLIRPHGVGDYDLGRYTTTAGPLYVSGGLGTWLIPVRFGCPPEWVVISL